MNPPASLCQGLPLVCPQPPLGMRAARRLHINQPEAAFLTLVRSVGQEVELNASLPGELKPKGAFSQSESLS